MNPPKITRFLFAGAFIDGLTNAGVFGRDNGLYTGDIMALIFAILNLLLGFVGIIAACGIVWGGFLYVTAGLDEDNAKKGKKIIVWAVTGLVIIGMALLVTNAILSTFSP